MSGEALVLVLGRRALPVAHRLAARIEGARIAGPRDRIDTAQVDELFTDPGAALREAFLDGRPIVALAATGIVVRLLAPVLHDKMAEPPVVVVAEDGSAVLPLLGGHRGANRLARMLGEVLGVPPAITTASDLHGGTVLDEPPEGWRLADPTAVKAVAAALLEKKPVALAVEAGGSPPWLDLSPPAKGLVPRVGIRITARAVAPRPDELVYHPAVLALGIGSERGVAAEEVADLVETSLAGGGLSPMALACVATLDLKEDEPAIRALADRHGVPLRLFEAPALDALTPRLATPSDEVFSAVGCHGVAEAAALAAAGPEGRLIVAKRRSARATCGIAEAPRPIDPAAVGRPPGHLAIVGLGPGADAWRTPEADRLIRSADHLVGYRGYLAKVRARDGQTRHAFALGEETERCRHALALAAGGARVALVCSGDPGIFAMASLVLEVVGEATDPAWARVGMVVSPGVSALQAAAARAGAPLGHDFCAISLSDLMTPWPVIERRLEAAAAGDFVTVLFNPASQRRRAGLDHALSVLRRHRPPTTPVVLAREVGRLDEAIAVDTLERFDPAPVDMLSLVIVGASTTRMLERRHGRPLVLTPRGYRAG